MFPCFLHSLLPFILAVALAHPPHHYIVTLTTYHPLHEQESLVRTLLSLAPPPTWRFLPRRNLAARTLPTDFVLLETAHISVISALRHSTAVRAISEQAQHARQPRSLHSPTDAQSGEERARGNGPQARPLPQPPALHAFGAGGMWKKGFMGAGVKVAVFDTGLIADRAYFYDVAESTDWTGENTTADRVGHGTFVAGLIAGSHPACPGIAPHAELHTFRVFTGSQVSYTSWFLDAFNYALHIGIDVLNLSIGGPDFADNPFTEKVNELTANGVIIVSAIGNDGPLWGSLNNPGDMMDVIGVGGAEPDGTIASFSSRGMTTHELDSPTATYGRVKPDLVAYGRSVVGPSHKASSKCRKLSGTSVASPVIAGAIVLLASTVPKSRRRKVVNPASIKRALTGSAGRLRSSSIYEQGAGILDMNAAFEAMQLIDEEFVSSRRRTEEQEYLSRRLLAAKQGGMMPTQELAEEPSDGVEARARHISREPMSVPLSNKEAATSAGPQAVLFPAFYDFTTSGCPYMWPHCAQPLFCSALPVNLNVTVLNPGGVQGKIVDVTWIPGTHGHLLSISVTPPQRFWPWAAGLGIHLSIVHEPESTVIAEGILTFRVISVHERTHSDVELPIRVTVIRAPQRAKRLLWDVYHSIRYPPGYVPRDNLAEGKDMLDWLGDHPHTNLHEMFRSFLRAGFYVDILDSPIFCLERAALRRYSVLLIFDPEDFVSRQERSTIQDLVKNDGLVLVVATEWYNSDVMRDIRFEDDNTRSWWSPVVAGANVPGINELLAPFGIAFGDSVLSGELKIGNEAFRFASGVPIVKFPRGGEIIYATQLRQYVPKRRRPRPSASSVVADMPVFGLTKAGRGSVVAFGDTNCIDTAYGGGRCYNTIVDVTRHAIAKCTGEAGCAPFERDASILADELSPSADGIKRKAMHPSRSALELFRPHSKVLTMAQTESELGVARDGRNGDRPVCEIRKSLQVRLRQLHHDRRRTGMVWDPPRYAEPLGTEERYYQPISSTWFSDARPSTMSGPSNVRRASMVDVIRNASPYTRLRPLVAVLSGIALIMLSVSVRSRKMSFPPWRRLDSEHSTWSWRSLSSNESRRTRSWSSFTSVLSGTRAMPQIFGKGSGRLRD